MICVFLAISIAVSSPNPYPTMSPAPSLSPPPFAPDGTYVYRLSRGTKPVGETTIVVERRASDNRFDIFERGAFGTVGLRMRGSLTYADLQPAVWDVTYAGVPLPTGGQWREKFGPVPRFTVRYEIDQDGSLDVVDGILGGDVWPLWSAPRGMRHVRYYTVFDPPFMAGVMTVPATLALRHETYIWKLSEVFPVYGQVLVRPVKDATAKNATWPHDAVIAADGVRIWYDPQTLVVHQAWFKANDVTVALVSSSPKTAAAISMGAP